MKTVRTAEDDLLGVLRRTQHALDRYQRSCQRMSREIIEERRVSACAQAAAKALEGSTAMLLSRRLRRITQRLAPPESLRRAVAIVARDHLTRWTRSGQPGEQASSDVPVVPMALQPEVSIVIPVHNHWEMTAACLRSIAADPAAVGYEVVVVDDCSTDETTSRLRSVVGVNVLRLEENRGFLGAVNAGLALARGRFVVLLNNDTQVEPGWLDALVTTAESDPQIGIVGAKLVYPDGRLQEAGGVIWSDGTGHNYGRDQDPEDPRFCFVRDVDYCSGACLLVRAELLTLLGGLDARYSPAYYEDTDLCFAARQHGYRVVYQPAAVVRHLEGASHGVDLSAGVKRFQEVNRQKFVEKWAAVLPNHGAPDPTLVRGASWRSPSGRCLVIDHALPMPDYDSGSRRMYELLAILSGLGFGVTFVPQNGIDLVPYREALTSRGVEVLRSPEDLDPYIKGVLPDLRLIVLSRPTVAWANYPMMRSLAPDAVLVYDTVDLHYVRERRRAVVETDSDQARKSADYHYGMEMSLIRLVDQVWVVSDTEAAALLDIDPTVDVAVVPNVHQAEPAGPPFATREGLLFIGNYAHDPNRDAALWLVEEIMPRVRRELGDVRLVLAGSRVTPEIESLGGNGVEVRGWVPDLEDLYRRSRIFVAPLRYGAGMKGKIGEACAFGLPVVTTPVGVEGMGLVDGMDVAIGEDAESFASAIVDVYRDQELWVRLASNGRRSVQERLSPGRVRRDLEATLKSLGLSVLDSI